MVLPITKLFSPTTTKQHRPLLNTTPYTSSTHASRLGSYNTQYAGFWRRFKTSPELYGIINILVTDILGDRPEWVGIKGEPLGRNKFYEAQRQWQKDRMKETLRAILFDEHVTGDGYGWKAIATDEQRSKVIKEALKQYDLKIKEFSSLYQKAMQDEDLKRPKRFDYIPSSTVKIENTLFDITGYTQVSNGQTINFRTDEVIHFRLNTLDGNVQGFTPVSALSKELALLYFVKGNMLAYMQNGGKPDILFTMENTQPNTNSFLNFQQQLINFKQLENSHGNLLGTGKVNVQDLSFGKDRDMEYQNLALWTMSGLLFAFGIPISRVPFLIGKAATGGDSGGLAEAGYQSMISEKQDEVEDLMNYQYFEGFGYHIRLPRHYKQDEVREAQTFSMNADTVSKLQTIYGQAQKKLTVAKLNELLGVSNEDLENFSVEDQMMNNPEMRNQNMLDNQSLEKEPDNRKRADVKRNVANDSANKGASV